VSVKRGGSLAGNKESSSSSITVSERVGGRSREGSGDLVAHAQQELPSFLVGHSRFLDFGVGLAFSNFRILLGRSRGGARGLQQ
jgi:hypothetical protein